MKPGENTDIEVAKVMGITPHAVYQYRKRHGIPNYRDNHIEWDVIDPLILDGDMSLRAIGRKFGIGKNVICRRKGKLRSNK